jgi:hypothetical protein
MTRRLARTFGLLAAVAAGTMFFNASAQAALVTGSFTGTVTDFSDPTDLLGLSTSVTAADAGQQIPGDTITGSFQFDSDLIDPSGTGMATLTITINDLITTTSATFSDTGSPRGFYGLGSFFAPSDGNYYMEANGGAPASISARVSLDGTGILAGVFAQPFTIDSGWISIYATESSDGEPSGPGGFLSITLAGGSVTVTEAPEPASLAMLVAGLLGLAASRRRRTA